MKIYLPVLTKYARHGGVSQFISNLSYSQVNNSEVKLFDHSGEINGPFDVGLPGYLSGIRRKFTLIKSMLLFPKRIMEMDHVLLNPSLGKISLMREMFYAKHCVNSCSFSVFFHGWSWEYAKELDGNVRLRKKYCDLLCQAENIFVLAEEFKQKLIDWGVSEELISLEKTSVNDDFLPGDRTVSFEEKVLNVLFLARVTRTKGVFEAVNAFNLHSKLYPGSKFTIAGDGDSLVELKEYVKNKEYENIFFVGFADNNVKSKLLEESDVFLLPSYTEGMPICIFEAMAYGLTVITRPVGGIPDFFREREMGFLIGTLEAQDFADALNTVAESKCMRSDVAYYNRTYVEKNVISSVVFGRIINKLTLNVY